MKTINQQKSADTFWKDEAGIKIPYARTTSLERKAERTVAKLAKDAVKAHNILTVFKSDLKAQVEQLYEAFCIENKCEPREGKHGITFYNFDRSIKVEVAISKPPTFDENTIELAKAKLDEVFEDGLAGAKEWIKPVIMDAFQTSNGKLDHKQVLGLRKYTDRVDDARYAEAMGLIDKSIRRPSSKEYFRVWIKDTHGEYIDVQLNFSAIKIED
ncbi:hypothetical protein ACVWYG_002561 [Pedobacter sp. UYEF25]